MSSKELYHLDTSPMKSLLLSICCFILLVALNCEQDNDTPAPAADPNVETFSTVTRITPNGIEAGDKFASAIDATSEFTVIGAIGDDTQGTDAGAVYILQRDGLTFSTSSKIIYGESTTNEDRFGFSVGISNSFVIVGAPYHDKYGKDAGLAYIFQRSGDSEWILIEELASPTPNDGDLFGYSVDIDRETVIVGSWQDIDNYYDTDIIKNGAGVAQGSVYVFDQSQNWELVQTLIPENDVGNRWDNFSRSLVIDGNQIMIGAPGTDNTSYDAPGRVYIFEKRNGSWVMDTFLESTEAQSGDFFGTQIDFDGIVLAATAPGNFNKLLSGTLNIEGMAFVYGKNATIWTECAKLEYGEIDAEDGFGSGGIVVQQNYVVVGAPSTDGPVALTGAAHFFERGTWSWSHEIQAPDPIGQDQFAGPLAITNDMLFVGAPRKCNSDGCLAGALYFVY